MTGLGAMAGATESGSWLTGKQVLITGGTGFLGQALALASLEHKAARVCLLSRGEAAQAAARRAIPDPEQRLRWFIGDVRDRERLRRAFHGIDLVIHAAALKRVEVGEYNPVEMVLTNVLGTLNVVEAAIDSGVDRVVAISSDKACMPVNAYGATKLTMEKLVLSANNAAGGHGPKFSVVRYGNVAGSTGSVIPIWREILRAGRTSVPVTHPKCSRFWMNVQEAVELIFWTARHMWGGELVVPLLPAYRLETLAAAMGAQMDIIGLGGGEKFDETMIAPFEAPDFRYHPPYLIRGGLASQYPDSNVAGVRTHVMDVDELRELLEELK